VPDARSYINPYPDAAPPKAKKVYSEAVLSRKDAGMQGTLTVP
jgi:hypothetical protein